MHKTNCKNGQTKLKVNTVKNVGLKTELTIECLSCCWKKRIKSEPDSPITTVKEYLSSFGASKSSTVNERYQKLCGDVNLKAVWGVMGTGGGYASLSEILSVIGVKIMSPGMFMRIERRLGTAWMNALTDILIENGHESLQLAIRQDRYMNDSYWTKVVCDGGWNKRSKGHDYTAKGCVAVIIDAYTHKLLYVGIKNKYCYICYSSEKAKKSPKNHLCFMNYKGPSKSMETEILVEGFRASEDMHNLQYLRYIGDGDSSVYFKLKQSVSYGSLIQKEECANHVTKNYTSYLHNLAKGNRGLHAKFLTTDVIQKLTKNLRGSIKKNSEDNGTAGNLKQLLRRGPDHVFGNHTHCDAGCAKRTQLPEGSLVEERWNIFPKKVIEDVRAGVENVCRKADLLKNDSTTNLAENYMSVAAKFIGGKQISRSKRWSYHARIHGASLSYSLGPKWHFMTWKKCLVLALLRRQKITAQRLPSSGPGRESV
jgi:hypothetical protein